MQNNNSGLHNFGWHTQSVRSGAEPRYEIKNEMALENVTLPTLAGVRHHEICEHDMLLLPKDRYGSEVSRSGVGL